MVADSLGQACATRPRPASKRACLSRHSAIHARQRSTYYGAGLAAVPLRSAPPMRLNPPSLFIFSISLLLAGTALISKFGAIGINVPRYLPHQEYWLAMVAYIVLMVGNLVRGL